MWSLSQRKLQRRMEKMKIQMYPYRKHLQKRKLRKHLQKVRKTHRQKKLHLQKLRKVRRKKLYRNRQQKTHNLLPHLQIRMPTLFFMKAGNWYFSEEIRRMLVRELCWGHIQGLRQRNIRVDRAITRHGVKIENLSKRYLLKML